MTWASRTDQALLGRGASVTLSTALIALILPLASTADAAEIRQQNHIRGARFDVHANVGGYASLGAGMRVDLPIVPDGFLNGADDELAISLGADVFGRSFYQDYYAGGAYLIPIVVAQWNFYVAPKWSVFPEAGIAMFVGNSRYLRHGGPGGLYAAPAFGLGGRYHFSDRNSLLVRISTPTGLQVGATF